MRLVLEELGHPQPPTPVHTDNSTAAGIANNTVKRQRSRSMEMRYFYVGDQVKFGYFDVCWQPGHENLGDYPSKHHPATHHQKVRPFYLHEPNSPTVLQRAAAPSSLRGCVGNIPEGYIRNSPLPVVPRGSSDPAAAAASAVELAGRRSDRTLLPSHSCGHTSLPLRQQLASLARLIVPLWYS